MQRGFWLETIYINLSLNYFNGKYMDKKLQKILAD